MKKGAAHWKAGPAVRTAGTNSRQAQNTWVEIIHSSKLVDAEPLLIGW